MSYPRLFTTPGLGAFAEAVDDERARQLQKWGDQRHADGTGDAVMFGMSMASIADMLKSVNDSTRKGTYAQWIPGDPKDAATGPKWLPIFLEEAFEAAAETDPTKLRAELVQCAAVIAAWISDLDRRPALERSDD